MSEVDAFARLLLEEAKRFLEKAEQEQEEVGVQAYLHAALNLGFCSLEAHVNSVADDFLVRQDLTALDRSILAEREVRLEGGKFELGEQLKMFRLEDRIQFCHRRFSGSALDRSAPWWGELHKALQLRNGLTHPKGIPAIDRKSVQRAIEAIVSAINALFMAVYQAEYPPARRGLQSTLSF